MMCASSTVRGYMKLRGAIYIYRNFGIRMEWSICIHGDIIAIIDKYYVCNTKNVYVRMCVQGSGGNKGSMFSG